MYNQKTKKELLFAALTNCQIKLYKNNLWYYYLIIFHIMIYDI